MIKDPSWWLFLSIMPLVYWRLPVERRSLALSLASFAILAVLAPFDMLVMLVLAMFVYLATAAPAELAGAAPGRLAVLRGWMKFGRFSIPVVAILAYLGWYKYAAPAIEYWRDGGSAVSFAIPLGISYFSFKLLHYALERGRGMLPAHGLWDFCCWLFLMPIFTSGPIERFDHFVEHRETRFRREMVIEGGMRIAQGLIKKFAILPLIVGASFELVGGDWIGFAHGPGGWRGAGLTWAYLALELATSYLDFSAYSDIAVYKKELACLYEAGITKPYEGIAFKTIRLSELTKQ